MTVKYDIIANGNSLRLNEGYLGFASLTLLQTSSDILLIDVGHAVNREILVNGLSRLGLKPKDVATVFFTHLHYDHVNNIDLFPFTTNVLVSQAEWEYVEAPHPQDPFVPWLVQEQLQKYNLQLLRGPQEILDGVNCFPTPGHTPGCYAVDFTNSTDGQVIVAGDAIKFPKEVITGSASDCFDTTENAARSIATIKERADLIIPGHHPPLKKDRGQFLWKDSGDLHLLVR